MPACAVEYVWCSGANTHHDLRSKIKCVTFTEEEVKKFLATPSALLTVLPVWNFDGSSTGQASGKDTEILIKPVAAWVHPFLQDVPTFVVLAECLTPKNEATIDNTRYIARTVFHLDEATRAMKPWFGLEQEYVFFKDGCPLGWPKDSNPPPQGPYYCSTGVVATGRRYAEEHMMRCLKMGLKISGINCEVMPGQWEYQVGPCEGIEAGDHALMARWVMLRVLEREGLDVNFDSKPKEGDWNGSGMHTNFSTADMRTENGMAKIRQAIENLARDPLRDVAVYGADNNARLSGHHETSRLDRFDYGVGTRHTSIRIPHDAERHGCGYFEDRRPSASADPYLVTARLFASACDVPSKLLDDFGKAREPQWVENLRKQVNIK